MKMAGVSAASFFTRLFRRMDPLQQSVERKCPVRGNGKLAVEHKNIVSQISDRCDDLGKIPVERPS
jgi:hypothetical protein